MRVTKADCSIRFRLRDQESESSTPITCFIEYDGKPVIKIATGLKISPNKWVSEKEKPLTGIKGLSIVEASIYLEKLMAMRNLISQRFRRFVTNNNTYPDKIKFKIDIIKAMVGVEENAKARDESFIKFIDVIIIRTQNNIRVKLSGNGKGQPFTKATVLSYKGTKNFLNEYLNWVGSKDLKFSEINLDFYWDLQGYIYNERKLSLNYFGKLIKHIKTFMREAEELGYHNNDIYRSKRFIKPQEETDAIYLNVDQLEKIKKLDLSNESYLDNARDLFLIGCWTGLRFQDYSQLFNKSKITGDFLHIERTAKTGAGVAIPLLPVVKEILEKYKKGGENLFPRTITNQKLNDYIKIIAEKAELSHPVSISIPVSGKRKTVTQPFHSIITTHSARRSFATNMFKHFNLPPVTIMKVTGHKSEAVFLKYIRMTPEENAQTILDAVNKKFNDDKSMEVTNA
ncbi:site-specific integrase [Pedobacter jamesrossensis]|uniref:Phage integrase SAM-like domain-containing protein n=1 Tax=Pedobacter jamesrossensis TaxID=1908238 RepID=A0ABV8NLI8_9SPHI